MQEHLADCKSHVLEFGELRFEINSILLIESLDCLLVGDRNGTLVQYRLDSARSRPEIRAKYLRLGIGLISSSISLGNLAVFGGSCNKLAVLDLITQKKICDNVCVAVEWVQSLSVCRVSEPGQPARVLLAVSGQNSDYSGDKSDLLDVTRWEHSSQILDKSMLTLRAEKRAVTETSRKIQPSESEADSETGTSKNSDSDSIGQAQRLQSRLRAAGRKIRVLKKNLSKANAENQKLHSKYKALKARLAEATRDFSQPRTRNQRLIRKIEKYKSKKNKARQLLKKIRSVKIEPITKFAAILVDLVNVRQISFR